MAGQQGQAFEDLRNTVSECTRIVGHRWRLALVGLAVVGAAAFWCSQYLRRQYTATTMFERRDDVVLQNLVPSNSPYGFGHLKATTALDMTGLRALPKAMVTTGVLPAETFSSEGALTERERAALDAALSRHKVRAAMRLVQSSPTLDLVSLGCDANHPGMARQIVVALRDNYIADTRARIREILRGTRAFFAGEVGRLQQQSTLAGLSVLDLRSAVANAPGFEPVEGYLGFVRELPLHPNEVPAFLPKRARAAARHARDRDGVVVQHDAALVGAVWQLYCRSMRRVGSINYPYRFFAELFARLGGRAWATVAWRGHRPVAGAISFVFGDTVMPYVLGVDERVSCDGAANLLFRSVMERAVRSGLRRFDYGRSREDNRGAIGFKKNQGFKPHPLGYQRFVPPGQKPRNLKPSNPRFALARQVWRKLPLPMTRALGAWLARSIPG